MTDLILYSSEDGQTRLHLRVEHILKNAGK